MTEITGSNMPQREWTPAPRDRRPDAPQQHRCGQCWTEFGKSAIPCPNEPKTETKETSS